MSLDLNSLRNAVASLERSLRVAQARPEMATELPETVRAGVIQNFEVTYELSWKFIQRWLRENSTPVDSDSPRTRKDRFRLASRAGLLGPPSVVRIR